MSFTPSTFRIIDSHVNAGAGELEGDPIKSKITPAVLLDLMEAAGIEQSVIFPVSRPSGYADANREIGDYVKQNPARFIGFGRMRSKPVAPEQRAGRKPLAGFYSRLTRPGRSALARLEHRYPVLRRKNSPELDRECQDELKRCFEEYGLNGIKMHPDEDGYPGKAVLDVLDAYRKPILLHCGRGISLRRIEEEIIRPYKLPVILAHMGGFPADRKLYLAALNLARKYPQVYLNTSFVFYTYILELAITSCPTKILFGSDSPGIHPHTAVTSIMPLRVSDEMKQMVFRDNLLRVLEI